MLVALFAGVSVGVGLGIIFRYGGTGGVDIIARFAHRYLGMGMGRTMFIFDAIVIGLSIPTYLITGKRCIPRCRFCPDRCPSNRLYAEKEGAYAARGAMDH